jgi:hypothetical protein
MAKTHRPKRLSDSTSAEPAAAEFRPVSQPAAEGASPSVATEGALEAAPPKIEGFRSWLERRWHLLLLLLAPLAILVPNSDAVYPRVGNVDSWIYYGFFENLFEFKRFLFSETYYASRVSWIFPGWLVHSIFQPFVAMYVLHTAVLYAVLLSIYYVVAAVLDRRTALIASLACGFYPFLWRATGSDYSDGAGIAYYLAALAFATKASQSKRRQFALILAGALLAAAIWSNFFWCLLCPPFLLHYLGVGRLEGADRRSLLRDLLLWMGVGFVSLTVLLAAVNYVIDGHWLFFMPAVKFTIKYGNVTDRWRQKGVDWSSKQFLRIAIVVLIAGAAVLSRRIWKDGIRPHRGRLLLYLEFVFSCAIWVFLEARTNPVLQLHYYASYLIPATFLGLAAVLPPFSAVTAYGIAAAAVAVVLRCSWYINGTPGPLAAELTGGSLLQSVPGGLLIAASGFWRRPYLTVPMMVAGLGILNYSVLPPFSDPNENREGIHRILSARSAVEAERQGRPIRLWYNHDEVTGEEYRSLASTYVFTYSLISEQFPAIPAGMDIEPGMLIVLPSARGDVIDEALSKLRPYGLTARVRDAGPIGTGPHSYHLFLLTPEFPAKQIETFEAKLNPGNSTGLLVPADSAGTVSFLKSGWKPWEGMTNRVESTISGILVHTDPKSYSSSARYARLAATEEGTYHFNLRYSAMFGDVSFGALKGDESAWLIALPGSLHAETSSIGFNVHLDKGQQFVLVVANSHADDQPSIYLLKSLTAVRLAPDGSPKQAP